MIKLKLYLLECTINTFCDLLPLKLSVPLLLTYCMLITQRWTITLFKNQGYRITSLNKCNNHLNKVSITYSSVAVIFKLAFIFHYSISL